MRDPPMQDLFLINSFPAPTFPKWQIFLGLWLEVAILLKKNKKWGEGENNMILQGKIFLSVNHPFLILIKVLS